MGRITFDFPQADNLELVYQVFIDLNENGLNRYSFSQKYNMADRQGAYYLSALCYTGLGEKRGKDTFLSSRGKLVQQLDEPFRKKVFSLSIMENTFFCDVYDACKGKEKSEQKRIAEIYIEGSYGIKDPATRARRARTLLSWYKWFENQDFHIEEHYYD